MCIPYLEYIIRDKVFKNGPSKIYPFKFFKGCLPQILLGPFLNTLPHIILLLLLCSKYRLDITQTDTIPYSQPDY